MKIPALPQSIEKAVTNTQPCFWLNPWYQNHLSAPDKPKANLITDAEQRLKRFAPLLEQLFPELKANHGLIESSLIAANKLNQHVNPVGGALYLKSDHALPVAGSIKARGGIHEVLCFAEELALNNELIGSTEDDYLKLLSDSSRDFFSEYSVVVGSTGNLGLSIGIIGSALGFNTVVHMSSDAKQWKKDRLRNRHVTVIEHQADYGAAVEAGRRASDVDPKSYFVDDENSPRLFAGYAVAALRLQAQLSDAGILVDADHPLFVYLPAGVGGAPGGITFGLKSLFGHNVHCFFAEPVNAPCMLLGMAGEPGSAPSPIYEFGIAIDTDADGLAVGTAAKWVCDATRDAVSGVYTATDAALYQHLAYLESFEGVEVEPSAAIACLGPEMLNTESGQAYLAKHNLKDKMDKATHIAWLTGGAFVPENEYRQYLNKARTLSLKA